MATQPVPVLLHNLVLLCTIWLCRKKQMRRSSILMESFSIKILTQNPKINHPPGLDQVLQMIHDPHVLECIIHWLIQWSHLSQTMNSNCKYCWHTIFLGMDPEYLYAQLVHFSFHHCSYALKSIQRKFFQTSMHMSSMQQNLGLPHSMPWSFAYSWMSGTGRIVELANLAW